MERERERGRTQCIHDQEQFVCGYGNSSFVKSVAIRQARLYTKCVLFSNLQGVCVVLDWGFQKHTICRL